jgi:tetratricopeptide (TPR) repeat protein
MDERPFEQPLADGLLPGRSDPLASLLAAFGQQVDALVDASQRARLSLRLALCATVITRDWAVARHHLEQAGAHPLAATLAQALALLAGDVAWVGVDTDHRTAAVLAGDDDAAAALRNLAEVHLFLLRDDERALAAAEALLTVDPNDDFARELCALALGALRDPVRLARLRGAPAEVERFYEGARLSWDIAGDAAHAARDAERARERAREPWPALVLLGELAACGTGDPHKVTEALLDRCGGEPRASTIAAAERFLLAQAVATREPERAQALYRQVSDAEGFGPVLARLAQLRLALQLGDWARVAEHYQQLGRVTGFVPLARAYLRRAAEVLETRVGDEARAERLFAELLAADAGDEAALRALERVCLLRGDLRELARYEGTCGAAEGARRAGLLFERAGELDAAAAQYRAAGDSASRLHHARVLVAQGDGAQLLDRYAPNGSEPRPSERDEAAQAVLVARAALELATGRLTDAERSLASAHAFDGDDGLVRVLRGALERRDDGSAGRRALEHKLARDPDHPETLEALGRVLAESAEWRDATHVLDRAVTVARTPARGAQLAAQLGDIYQHRLHDHARAQAAYDRAIDLFGNLSGNLDGAALPALRGLAQLHRQAGRTAELAATLERELAATTEPAERVALAVEIARHARDDQVALAHLRGALAIDAANAAALVAFERLCRKNGLWSDLAAALAAAPCTPRTARALGEALERLGRWQELAEIRRVELELCTDSRSAARVACALAALYEDRFGDAEQAAHFYRQAMALDGEDPLAAQALARLLESRQATSEHEVMPDTLATMLEIERVFDDARRATPSPVVADGGDARLAALLDAFATHPTVQSFEEVERLASSRSRFGVVLGLYERALDLAARGGFRGVRVAELHTRRGHLQLSALEDTIGAARSYRAALTADPHAAEPLRALETLLAQQGDFGALVVAYEEQADRLGPGAERAELLRKAARIATAQLRDGDRATRLYERALGEDPADVETADALERGFERARAWDKLVALLLARVPLARDVSTAIALTSRAATLSEEELGDVPAAVRHWQAVQALEPANKAAAQTLSRIYEGSELWAEFMTATERLIELETDPETKALLHFKCGSVAEAQFHDPQRAMERYEAAIHIHPACLPALHGLRDLLLRQKDYARVVQTLDLELEVWRDDAERAGVFARIGQIYAEHLGDTASAVRAFENALAINPQNEPASRALFDLYFAGGDWERAAPLGELLAAKAVRLGEPSGRSEFYRKWGMVRRGRGDARGAAESFVMALELRPDALPVLDELVALARQHPTAYDFAATSQALERLYRRRDDKRALARLHVIDASLARHALDLEGAQVALARAEALDPATGEATFARADLLVALRRHGDAIAALDVLTAPGGGGPHAVAALLRQAEIASDHLGDSHRAAALLEGVLRANPAHREAGYRLAQEWFVLGRFSDAGRVLERLLQENDLPALERARYEHLSGRVREATGDRAGAELRYRAALVHDAAQAAASLALARLQVAAAAGGESGAGAGAAILAAALRVARDAGDAERLQRARAQLSLARGAKMEAAADLAQLAARDGDTADDRLALAELYASEPEGLPRAIAELEHAVDANLGHAPTLRLLATLRARLGERQRVARLLALLELMGDADDFDRAQLTSLRARRAELDRGATLTDHLRDSLLLPAAARGPLAAVASAVLAHLRETEPVAYMGEDVQPATDGTLLASARALFRLFRRDARVKMGRRVPGLVQASDDGGPVIVLDVSFLTSPESERRFAIGRALMALELGVPALMRREAELEARLVDVLHRLCKPEAERDAEAQALVRALPRKLHRALDAVLASPEPAGGPVPEVTVAALAAAADRAGLCAADDLGAAARVLVRATAAGMDVREGDAVPTAAIPGGGELVRFYLSDAYDELLRNLAGKGAAS